MRYSFCSCRPWVLMLFAMERSFVLFRVSGVTLLRSAFLLFLLGTIVIWCYFDVLLERTVCIPNYDIVHNLFILLFHSVHDLFILFDILLPVTLLLFCSYAFVHSFCFDTHSLLTRLNDILRWYAFRLTMLMRIVLLYGRTTVRAVILFPLHIVLSICCCSIQSMLFLRLVPLAFIHCAICSWSLLHCMWAGDLFRLLSCRSPVVV